MCIIPSCSVETGCEKSAACKKHVFSLTGKVIVLKFVLIELTLFSLTGVSCSTH